MKLAIKEAIKAVEFGEHPVGAVVVKDDIIISIANNRTHRDVNPTHHAEVVAIQEATKKLKTKRLDGCVLYSTHEPCPMCATAIIFGRLSGVVYGTSIDDIKKYSLQTKSSTWRWRNITIPLKVVIENGDWSVFSINGFLKGECQKLLDLV